MEDLGQFEWGCFGESVNGADGTSIGTGYQNTMDIVDQWWKTARDHPELYDDSESKTKNDETFKENRHDQSNISILCKLNEECKGEYLDDVIKVTRISK